MSREAIILSAIAIAINFVALVVAFWRWRSDHRAAALAKLHDQILQPEMQMALRLMYSRCHDNPDFWPANAAELHAIEYVLNMYDIIGFRVKKKLLPKGDTIATEGAIALAVWTNLKSFILKVRKERDHKGGGKEYKSYLQGFADEVLKQMTEESKAALSQKPYQQWPFPAFPPRLCDVEVAGTKCPHCGKTI